MKYITMTPPQAAEIYSVPSGTRMVFFFVQRRYIHAPVDVTFVMDPRDGSGHGFRCLFR